MDTKHCVVDGWVDDTPAPGPGDTATFTLVVRPVDIDTLPEDAPDTLVSCTSDHPQITHELLTGIQPSDLVRITGTLTLPQIPGEPALLTVDGLDVLDTAPVLRDMVLDRYGDYCVIFDADHDQVPVFTAHGQWVGLADTPDTIATLIDIHKRVTGGDT